MFDFPSLNFLEKAQKVKGKEIEVQEILLDKLAGDQKAEEFGEQRIELPLSQTILRLLYGAFLLIALVFLGKSLELQVFAANELQEAAAQNAIRNIPLASRRGVIYDSSFAQLVFNRPSFDFVCDKLDMPSSTQGKEDIFAKAASILGTPFEDLKKDFQENLAPRILVKENLSHEELVLLEARSQEFEGCATQENIKRDYAKGETFSHVLGYTAKISLQELSRSPAYSVADYIGKTGVEKAYETALRGNPGSLVYERDVAGRTVAEKGEIPSEPGDSVVLWLDAGLQERISLSMEQTFSSTGTKKGAAVALDPQTGGVLALVSFPSFDNNIFSEGISQKEWEMFLLDRNRPLFNRAISGIGYPTGSVIKPLMGVAALQEHIIEEETKIFAPLELCVQNVYTKEDECFRDWTFHGTSNLARAIAESVNTFFYIIGGGDQGFQGLGPERIKEYLERFGWGAKTGIDIPGEGQGILPEFDQNWRLGDTYHFSIGQGPFAVTPLQVATAFSAIANGGTLYEPQAAKLLVDEERNVLEVFEPRVKKEHIANEEILEAIRKGMRQTVTAGSATGWLDSLPVQAAAKTGTAQTGRKTSDGKDYLYSWTVAFAPLGNPEIVVVAVVEDVKEGQVAALPVVRNALQWYFNQ